MFLTWVFVNCLLVMHFVASACDIPASSDDEEDDEDYDPDNDEYWKKVSLLYLSH